MQATRLTSDKSRSDLGRLSDRGRQELVIATQTGEDVPVVASMEGWARLSQRDRKVGAAEDLPDECLGALLKAEVPAKYAYLDAELH